MAIEAGLLGFLAGTSKGAADVFGMKIKNDLTTQRELSLLDVKNRYAKQQLAEERRLKLAQFRSVLESNPELKSRMEDNLGTPITPELMLSMDSVGLDNFLSQAQERTPEQEAARDVRGAAATISLEDDVGLTDRRLADTEAEAYASGVGSRRAAREYPEPDELGEYKVYRNKNTGQVLRIRENDPKLDELMAMSNAGRDDWRELDPMKGLEVSGRGSNEYFQDPIDGTWYEFNPNQGLREFNPDKSSKEDSFTGSGDLTELGYEFARSDNLSRYANSIEAGVGPIDALEGGLGKAPVFGHLAALGKADIGQAQAQAKMEFDALEIDAVRAFTVNPERPGTVDQERAQRMKPIIGAIQNEEITAAQLKTLANIARDDLEEKEYLISTEEAPDNQQIHLRRQASTLTRLIRRSEEMLAADLISRATINRKRLVVMSPEEIKAALDNDDIFSSLTNEQRLAIRLRSRQLHSMGLLDE